MSFYNSRPNSGVSKRGNSASGENKNLRDAIGKLQQDLLHSRAETQKFKDQLNCLILLVKRSWSGDKEASLHVANIVGAAPPEISVPQPNDNAVTVTVKPKSRAVNNWALLTIGALNRHYKRYEIEIEEQQRTHLIRRIEELDEHLLHNRDLQLKLQHDLSETEAQSYKQSQCQEFPRKQSLQKQNIDKISHDKPPSAGVRKKPPVRHLYRPAQKEPDQPTDISLGDLFMQSNEHKLKQQTNQAFESLYRHKLHASQNGSSKGHAPDTDDLDYDDPKRYVKMDLYESEQMLGEDTFGRRKPQISIEYQRSSDAYRSRPKSSVSGRPLKYETTRPISAYSKDKKETNKIQHKRIKSAPARSRKQPSPEKDLKSKKPTFLTEEKDNEEKCLEDIEDLEDVLEEEQEKHEISQSSEEEDPFKIDAERRKKQDEELREKIKYPESASEFELEMQKIMEMEKNFKKNTLSLQKKLGINPDGLI